MQEAGHSECPFSSLLFLVLLPSPYPPQVRSSLGTNILSAMAAFAGTAILLMDFGVTNWVCWQMFPGRASRSQDSPVVRSPGLFAELQ